MPPNSLVVRWVKGLEEEAVLRKLRDPEERELLPGHVTLLYDVVRQRVDSMLGTANLL